MRVVRLLKACLIVLLGWPMRAEARPIILSPTTLVVNAISATGTAVVIGGTVTSDDTLSILVTGKPCLQVNVYCTNPAGIVTVGGTSLVGQVSTDPQDGTTFGALLLRIPGAGLVQVFPATFANSLGSLTPAISLVLPPVTLASLGFAPFTLFDPVFIFTVSDVDSERADNTGAFTVSGLALPVPEPATLAIVGLGLAGLMAARTARRFG